MSGDALGLAPKASLQQFTDTFFYTQQVNQLCPNTRYLNPDCRTKVQSVKSTCFISSLGLNLVMACADMTEVQIK